MVDSTPALDDLISDGLGQGKQQRTAGGGVVRRILPDIVEWVEQRFYIAETKAPIKLQPVQKAVLREFFRQDAEGRFIYRTGLYSTIKKSGKTTIAALVMQWATETWGDYLEIYHLGNKLNQAKERAFKLMKRSIELSPHTDEWELNALSMRHLPTGNVVQALPVNAAGEAGGNHALTTWTEFHGYVYEENNRMWAELQPVPTQPLSFRFVESYAGYEGESMLLWDLWQRGLKGRRVLDEFPVYAAEGGLIAYIDTGKEARRMPWQQDISYYIQAQTEELPHEYMRVHENRWAQTQNAFIDLAVWDSLIDHRPPGSADQRRRVVLAADASVTGDCTALTAVSYDPETDTAIEERTQVWSPDGVPLDYSETLEPAIHDAFKRFNVVKLVCDPYQLHDMITRLQKRYGEAAVQAFDQGAARVESDTALLMRLRQGRFRHRGDPTVRTHVQNADTKAAGDKAIRIIKRKQTAPIDAVIAISMAAQMAHELLATPKAGKITALPSIADIRKRKRRDSGR